MDKGFLITIEGIEGVGKSTILETLQSHFIDQELDILVTREPGGTPVAESIRQTLLTDHDEPMHPDTMLHNYFGSDGGTDMKQSPEEFLAGLGKSVLYWKNRAMLAG